MVEYHAARISLALRAWKADQNLIDKQRRRWFLLFLLVLQSLTFQLSATIKAQDQDRCNA